MTGEFRPDDVPHAPSGRVPKWVLDEARGIEPTERVPFRGPTSAQQQAAGRRNGRRWVTITAAVALAAGAMWFADSQGWSSTALPASQAVAEHRNYPPAGREERHSRILPPVAVSEAPSSSYRFLSHLNGSSKPVTWSPCRPIHYVVRPDHAPPGGQQLIESSFARLGAATGLTFVYDGTTTEGPSEDREYYKRAKYGDRWAPVLVTWATHDEVPDFAVDIAGEAGPGSVTTPSGVRTYVTGTVAFDAAWFDLRLRGGDTAPARSLVLHELGHLAGLQHVDDQAQIMFPRVSASDYGAGDLAGLAQLGRGSCHPDI